MSTKNIINNILDENLFGAKKDIIENLYEKVSIVLQEKRKKKYAKVTDNDDDGEGLDPVEDDDTEEKEQDDDVDNDGDKDDSDEYLKNRRKTVKKAVKKDDKEEEDEEVKEGIVRDSYTLSSVLDQKFLQIKEAQQLDEIPFLLPLAGMAARAVGGGLIKKLGGGLMKKLGGGGLKGLLGKGRQLASTAMSGGGGNRTAAASHTHEAKSSDDVETIYDMEKDKYMKLSDEQKDKIKAKYHRKKHEMENTRK